MGEAAMVSETERGTAKTTKNVQIGSLGGERHCERGQRRLAVESDASEAGAGQEVGDRFQSVRGILFRRYEMRHQRRTGRLSEVNLTREFGARRKVIGPGAVLRTKVLMRSAPQRGGASSVRASGTIVISAGRVPRSSPSAST